MFKIGIDKLPNYLQNVIKADVPLMIYGPPGIGKSEITSQQAKKQAAREKREYLNWAELSISKKHEAIRNPEKFYIFYDIRLSQCETSELKGIPGNLSGDQSGDQSQLELLPYSWITYYTQPNASGLIFFDEINLAPPSLAAAAYMAINDRIIADRALSKHVRVMAAGNRTEDKAFTFEMPLPLRDRFAEVEVTLSPEAWKNWAHGKINPHLISFIGWKESRLLTLEKMKEDKGSTPRGVTRASKLIEGLDLQDPRMYGLISIAVGEAFANEFNAYIKHFKSLNWNEIYSNPKSIKELKLDQLFAVMGGLVEHYAKLVKEDGTPEGQAKKKKDKNHYLKQHDSICRVMNEMPIDFITSTLSQMKNIDFNTLIHVFGETKSFDQEVMKKCEKYLEPPEEV